MHASTSTSRIDTGVSRDEQRIESAPRWGTATSALAMLVGVVMVYCPWSVLSGQARFSGVDFEQLHASRMTFAREAIFGPAHSIPAWYPRELMGTPFRADLQNFPLIPTRLAVVLLLEPDVAFMVSVIVSALLAAVFTFLICRRLGISRIGSAAAGWTFACCGFYASRIPAGHLPLLEAYPSLPALLWLMDRALAPREVRNARSRPRSDGSLIALALTTTCFSLAGHPQLTVYSLAVTSAYALVRAPSLARAALALCAMALGVGISAFALYPMSLLTARSTRVLPLAPASNDIAMPYDRLAALLFPWKDGAGLGVSHASATAFHGYPNSAYYWDTVWYVGWEPCVAAVGLMVLVALRRIRIGRAGWFFAAVSGLSLLMALPIWQAVMSHVPGTGLRSPARLGYVVVFGLSLGLGAALTLLARLRAPTLVRAGLLVGILLAHAVDLSLHARAHLRLSPYLRMTGSQEAVDQMRRILRGGRMGIDAMVGSIYNRALDDAGFFASIILARPYQFLIDTSGMPATLNEQHLDASKLSERSLRLCGVRYVVTIRQRPDLVRVSKPGEIATTYLVSNASERVALFPPESIRYVTPAEMRGLLRDPAFPAESTLLLPEAARPANSPANAGPATDQVQSGEWATPLRYRRPSSDEITVDVTTERFAWLRLLETWDPGWSATLDGKPVPVVPAHDTFLTVAVPEGSHELSLRYRTPGAGTGVALSGLSVVALFALAIASARRMRPVDPRRAAGPPGVL